MAKGLYLTIGINHVSSFYVADPLNGCVHDAEDVAQIAESQGFQKPSNFAGKSLAMLVDSEATRDRVLREIAAAAKELSAGDIFLLQYSGHGLEDSVNPRDETGDVNTMWATFDRPILDDELFDLWFKFPDGVRILVLSDSCHSGTVVRRPDNSKLVSRNLGSEEKQIATIQNQAGEFQALTARAAQLRSTNRGRVPGAGVLLLSACLDDQLASDLSTNGLFTQKLIEVWNDGAFHGDYLEFHEAIADKVMQQNPDQNPNKFVVGNSDITANFPLQRVFKI
jgi:hypothetical protein